MIVDCHTHVGEPEHLSHQFVADARMAAGNPKLELTVKLADHWEAMKTVDKAVVLGFRAHHVGYVIPNEYVADYVKTHPDKLIGFCSIDPNDMDAIEQLEYCVKTLGLKGLKLGPIYQNMHPHDPRFQALFARAAKLEVPILIHQGTTFCSNVSLDYANPVLLQDVALRHPNLKLVIAHMGHPWIGETLVLIRKHPSLYADISALYYRPWQFYNALILAQEYGVTHKLLFGSDYPVTTPASTQEALAKVNQFTEGTSLPRVDVKMINDLIHRDTTNLLDLS
jgi:predicted TIM-barrel fold metal-dependent hydrolase